MMMMMMMIDLGSLALGGNGGLQGISLENRKVNFKNTPLQL